MKIINVKYFLTLLFFNTISCNSPTQRTLTEEVHDLNLKLIKAGPTKQFVERKYLETESIKSKYIGGLNDKVGNKFYILNTVHIENKNESPRYTNFVMLYDEQKEFLGHYYLSAYEQLPTEVIDNEVVFDDICIGENLKIPFENGIPRAINLGCQDSSDFYELINPE